MYTIFKNLTIILIAYGEVIWFGSKVTPVMLLSFFFMVRKYFGDAFFWLGVAIDPLHSHSRFAFIT